MKRQNWWEMPKGPFWTTSRVVSLLVFLVVNAAGAVFTADAPDSVASRVMAPAFLGLVCIWFPEGLGSVSKLGPDMPAFTKETPSEVVYWFGWVMLIGFGILFIVL